jgi:hypothetical protein
MLKRVVEMILSREILMHTSRLEDRHGALTDAFMDFIAVISDYSVLARKG